MSNELITDLEIYLRYSDDDVEIGHFSIKADTLIKLDNKKDINYEKLMSIMSYDGLFENESFLNAAKKAASEFSLVFDKCPQLWVTKINQIDLTPIYDAHFNQNEKSKSVAAAIFKVEENEVDDTIEEYFTNTVFSVENLFS